MRAQFLTNCVSSTARDITPMVDAERNITRRTFLKHVDRRSLERVEAELGYSAHPAQGLTMAGDYHVAYYRSTFRGKPCVFFRWSAIEYVFVPQPWEVAA